MSRKIIVIGAGGIGSHMLRTMCMYLNSREDHKEFELVIVDGDKYETNNANRQDFVTGMVGMNKAKAQALRCAKVYPELKVTPVDAFLGQHNIETIITDGSIVLSCVDNHFCRALVSKHCQGLKNVLLISGGNELYDGNVQVYERRDDVACSPTIEERHPEILLDKTGDRSAMSCEQLGNLPSGGQIMCVNNTAATVMVNLLWSYLNGEHIYEITEIFFDIRGSKQARVIDGCPE